MAYQSSNIIAALNIDIYWLLHTSNIRRFDSLRSRLREAEVSFLGCYKARVGSPVPYPNRVADVSYWKVEVEKIIFLQNNFK